MFISFYDKIFAVNGFLDLKASKVFKQFIVFSENLLSNYGYNFIKLPIFDNFENQSKTTSNYNELISIRSSKEIFVLRKDMTYQVANYIASLKERNLPMKIYYEGEVFSWDYEIKVQYQLGLECIGCEIGILEVIDIIYKLLSFFDNDIIVYINDESITKSILEHYEDKSILKDALKKKKADVLRKYSLDWIMKEYEDMLFKKFSDFKIDYDKLKKIFTHLRNKGLNVKLDASEIKALPYYDGITFSFYSSYYPFKIASGGEYQILKDVYSLDINACGGAIYLSNILEKLS